MPATQATNLAGERAVVTGGAGGIGRAIANELASLGVRVADADGNRAQFAASEIGPEHLGFAVGVRSGKAVGASFQTVTDVWGGYGFLVGNAGVSTIARAIDLTEAGWDFNFDVDARGIFLTNQAAIRHFRSDGARFMTGQAINVTGGVYMG